MPETVSGSPVLDGAMQEAQWPGSTPPRQLRRCQSPPWLLLPRHHLVTFSACPCSCCHPCHQSPTLCPISFPLLLSSLSVSDWIVFPNSSPSVYPHPCFSTPPIRRRVCTFLCFEFGLGWVATFNQWGVGRYANSDFKCTYMTGPSLPSFSCCHQKNMPWVSFRFSENETQTEQTWSKLVLQNQAKISRTTPTNPQLHVQENAHCFKMVGFW